LPSRPAEASTCPQCESAAAAHPAPSSAGPVLTTRAPVSVTVVLVGINLFMFVAMVLKGASVMQPDVDQLLRWGANFGPLTIGGQWWRLLTAMFVHIGIVHMALNMWALWNLGTLAEYLYGAKTFLALYLLSGLAASLASLAHNPLVTTAGASGAIFGVAGALISTLYLAKLPTPRSALRTSLISLIVFAGYSLAYGFVKGGIDNGAHIGGLVSGLLLGAVLTMDFGRARRAAARLRPLVFPAFALVLAGGAYAVREVHTPVVRLEKAEEAFRRGDSDGALRELNEVLRARPKYAPAWFLMGTAYVRNHQDDKAEAAFRRAAELNPKNPAPLAQLGVMYLRAHRYEQAREMFHQITVVNPKDADAQVNLGVTLNLMGRGEEALASFRRATELNPKLPLAWYNFGLASMNLKHYDDAVDAFVHTTKLMPKDAEAWIWLANAYEAKGMREQADAAYMTGYKLRAAMRPRPARAR
jgi:membrane associated rhomboid family serine protease/Flp pilus assembly protein TadD